MKRLMLASLLAVVALAPVAARAQRTEMRAEDGAREWSDRPRLTPEQREQRRAERAVRRAERGESGVAERPRREGWRDRRLDGDGERLARPDGVFPRREGQMFPPARERGREERGDRRWESRRDDRRDWRGDRREARRDWRYDRRDDLQQWREDRRDWNSGRRDGWGRDAYRGGLVWNRGWRADRRYDWSRHRELNRGQYRLPRYYAPYGHGYSYRRFGLGATLSRSLFAPGYWIDDPLFYRLPPAYGPYRWVRYHGDALLIDLRTGRVIDVIHDIFW